MSKTRNGKESLHLEENYNNRNQEKPPDAWELLAMAVVERAIRDYSAYFARVLVIDEHPEYVTVGCFRDKEEKLLTRDMNALLEWFDSEQCAMFCGMSKERILEICDKLIDLEKINQEKYYAKRYKKLKKFYDASEVYVEIGRKKDSNFYREWNEHA